VEDFLKKKMCNQGETLQPQLQPKMYDVKKSTSGSPSIEPQPKLDAVLDDEIPKKHVENSMFCQCQGEKCVKRRKSLSVHITYGLQFISAIIFGITIALVIRFYEVSFMIIAAVCSIVILGFIFTHHEILRDIQKQIHKKTEKSNSDDLREDDEKSEGFWDTDMDKKDKKCLIDLNQKIKVAAGVVNPNPNYLIELLDEVYRFPVDPRILKENLDIVHTVKAIRGYVGPVSHIPGISPLQGEELNARIAGGWLQQCEMIRLKANAIWYKFHASFSSPMDDKDPDLFMRGWVDS